MRCLLLAWFVLLAGCAGPRERVASAASQAWRADTSWAFEHSDVPLDPAYRFGRLANGMRYVVRANATPKGTAVVRMEVGAGSLDERPDERGYAHFVEHMAFEGSTHVPQGEMVRLLEREGLAFGADTNAATGFAQTTYALDLPTAAPRLIDTALLLMRETASELAFASGAVDRERGVVLAEMRDRDTWAYRDAVDDARFYNPRALYTARFPIGTRDSVAAADAAGLKAFWAREYVPAHTTLIVIGDFDAAEVEAKVRRAFGDWTARPAETQPDAGPVPTRDSDRAEVYVDPALTERVIAARHGAWLVEPDTLAQRRENLLRVIGYNIVNRRLLRIARQPDGPFRGAGFGTGDVFEAGRTTRLIVDTGDGQWRRGLVAAATEVRRALAGGFTRAEVAEQVANIRTAAALAAQSAGTRGNRALADAALALVRDRLVPSAPVGVLARLDALIPAITPEAVLAALRREAVPIRRPLLRFEGRRAPTGGARALRAAWRQAMRAPLGSTSPAAATGFAYTDFGAPGRIVADTAGPLGIRELRFANGVMLNLRRTDIERGSVLVKVSVDGGDKLDTKADPLATEMFGALPLGGLGRHSQDELDTLLSGHVVANDLRVADDSFVASARTTPGDLSLELRLLAATITDPGYRAEGEVQYRVGVNAFFARKDAMPGSGLQTALGGILSDGDPRFTLQPADAYRALTFAKLKAAISDRLARGAIEVGIVGDVDEAAAIDAVARTFGALPAREPAFRAYAGQPPRGFTATRARRIVRHAGPAEQAMLELVWPTRDDADPVETLELALLERVAQIGLTEGLREKLGQAYSPWASSDPSHAWPGYGTFALAASVETGALAAARDGMLATVRDLRAAPVDADLLARAREPMLAAYDNALKTNAGWLELVDRAQSQPGWIERYQQGRARLAALTAADVREMALRYLDPARAVEVIALPQGAEAQAAR